VELQLYADVLAQQPDNAQLQAFYNANKDRYMRDGTMQLRDLVAPDAAAAKTAAAALTQALKAAPTGGPALDAAITRAGLRDSQKLEDSGHIETGDIFDFAAHARLDPAVYAAALQLASGQVSAPITASDGTHVLVMVKRVAPAVRPFAEVADQVWRDVGEDSKKKVRDANMQYLRSKADIELAVDAKRMEDGKP
jgi:peptidyl-prolyl cis-trans isomerase D